MWEWKRKWLFPGRGSVSTLQNNMHHQLRLNAQIPPRQGDNKTIPFNPVEGVSGEKVWVGNVE